MKLFEVQHNRNWIRSGDICRVKPSRSGKHDGFAAKFLYADADRSPYYALLQLDEKGRPVAYRFVNPDRVRRLASTKHPRRPS